MKVYRRIESEEDWENWMKNESEGCESSIEDLDEHDGWGEVWEYIYPMLDYEMSKTELNDFMMINLPEVLSFFKGECA